jgi:hypothetical protein
LVSSPVSLRDCAGFGVRAVIDDQELGANAGERLEGDAEVVSAIPGRDDDARAHGLTVRRSLLARDPLTETFQVRRLSGRMIDVRIRRGSLDSRIDQRLSIISRALR